MRWNEQWKEFASACASVVLPTPGTSSISRCPLDSSATIERRMTSSLPRMTREIELCNCAIWFAVAVVIWLKIPVASVTNIECGLYSSAQRFTPAGVKVKSGVRQKRALIGAYKDVPAHGRLAQWLERSPHTREVQGSSP